MDQCVLEIKPGTIVLFNAEKYEVLRSLDEYSILARKIYTQQVQRLFKDKLEVTADQAEQQPGKTTDLLMLGQKDWEMAQKRFEVVSLYFDAKSNDSVASIAQRAGIHKATLYRWINKFNRSGKLSSLINDQNNGCQGRKRLNKEVEAIIQAVINERYLTTQRLTVKRVVLEIAWKCKAAGLPAANYKTVRKRIAEISEDRKLAKRYDKSVANNMYEPVLGSFPGAGYPLSVVQIDHTLLDLIIVDDISRQPVGRPWITVAIDVFSRMILGFYVSLDSPGAMGTGLCLSHAILPKDLWLAKMSVEGRWPCYGIMRSVHLDNAKEFHGCMLERACQEYGIEIDFRPVKTPKYGGHIERLIGTVLGEVHALKGTTFSDPAQRKFYKSEKQACFTIGELEKWLTTFIVNVYHNRFHKSINTTPAARYSEGIPGSANQLGTGLQKPVVHELKLRLDFMPFIERTIQKYGVQISCITYYHDILRKWIHAHANAGHSRKRKFIFKIDPRDISVVYFYDPEIKDYFAIPYRNTSLPPMTIWEHREILRCLHKNSNNEITEEAIFEAYAKMKEIEENASKVTSRTRRKNTRARHALQKSIKTELTVMKPDEIDMPDERGSILPFEDLEDEPFK